MYNCIIQRSDRFPYIKIEKMSEKVDRLFPAFHLTKEEKETFPPILFLFQKFLRIVVFLNRKPRTLLNLSEYLSDIFTDHAQTNQLNAPKHPN